MAAENSITAVVSLYNPDPGVLENCRALLEQVNHVVAVDDGSPRDVSGVLGQLEVLGCQVVRLGRNSGIASALNAGIRSARQNRCNPAFILTMDQDSLLEPGYTGKLVAAYKAATSAGVPVAMVAPGSISGLPTRRTGTVQATVLGGEPIQSGLLVPTSVLDGIGLLMDDLFIDGVDTEFYLRARSAGMESVVAEDARLDHALGSMSEAVVFGIPLSLAGRPLRVRTAAAYRYYYIFRNRLLLVRKYWRSHPGWAVKGLLADYRHLAIVTVLAPGRAGRLGSALAGLRDGIRGRTGPRPHS